MSWLSFEYVFVFSSVFLILSLPPSVRPPVRPLTNDLPVRHYVHPSSLHLVVYVSDPFPLSFFPSVVPHVFPPIVHLPFFRPPGYLSSYTRLSVLCPRPHSFCPTVHLRESRPGTGVLPIPGRTLRPPKVKT